MLNAEKLRGGQSRGTIVCEAINIIFMLSWRKIMENEHKDAICQKSRPKFYAKIILLKSARLLFGKDLSKCIFQEDRRSCSL